MDINWTVVTIVGALLAQGAASYFDGTQFVTGLANKSISRYPVEGNPLPDVLGTFRPVNFDV